MPRLNKEKKAEILSSIWRDSIVGLAILKDDLSYELLNDQWLQILNAPASDFYNKHYVDLTEPHIQNRIKEEAQLAIKGSHTSFAVTKLLQLTTGSVKKVQYVITRVPRETELPFLFFVCQMTLIYSQEPESQTDSSLSPRWTKESIKKIAIAVGTAIGAALAGYGAKS